MAGGGRMTRKAHNPKRGNRYTTPNMTAREAQTLDGCIRKMVNVSRAMKARGVYYPTTDELDNAIQSAVNSIVRGGRMDEVSPWPREG